MAIAFQKPSRQLAVTPVSVELDDRWLGERLAEMLAVPSYSYPRRDLMDPALFEQLHALIERRFPRTHEVLRREHVNQLSLLYQWPGSDPSLEPIMLMSHLDVVPVQEATRDQWQHPQGTVADGFVWGRGALDVKCGVIGILGAVEHLIEAGFEPRRTLLLGFGHDEEVGGERGNAAIAALLAERGTRLACVLDEGGAILDGVIPNTPRPVAFVATAEKRAVHLKLVARGAGGHGSMPGRSAIVNLAEAIVRLQRHPMPARLSAPTRQMFDFLGPEMPLVPRVVMGNAWLFEGLIRRQLTASPETSAVVRSTLNVTQLSTESANNQNATFAEATVNVRLLPGDSPETVQEYVEKLTADLRLADGRPAITCDVARATKGDLVSPVECEEFRLLQRSIHEVFPDVIVAPGLTAVSTDSSWYYPVTDKVYRFIPMRLSPQDLTRIHGINERIAVENLGEIARFYSRFIRNAAG